MTLLKLRTIVRVVGRHHRAAVLPVSVRDAGRIIMPGKNYRAFSPPIELSNDLIGEPQVTARFEVVRFPISAAAHVSRDDQRRGVLRYRGVRRA